MKFEAVIDGKVVGSYPSQEDVERLYPSAIARPVIPVSRYFAIARNERRIIDKGYTSKAEAAAAHPAYEVVSGFELRSIWSQWGSATLQPQKEMRGGGGRGAGRHKSKEPDKRIKVSTEVYNEICSLQSAERLRTRKAVSAKAVADSLIHDADEGAIALYIRRSNKTDKVIMRIGQSAYEQLQFMVESINEKSPPIDANLGNLMAAIVKVYRG